jgi:hypothetical protein
MFSYPAEAVLLKRQHDSIQVTDANLGPFRARSISTDTHCGCANRRAAHHYSR